MFNEPRPDRPPPPDEPVRALAPSEFAAILLDRARRAVRRYRFAIPWMAVAAIAGGCLGGGFVWLWHGDWSESGNPLVWNPQAQMELFSCAIVGAVSGAVFALAAAVSAVVSGRRQGSGPRR